MNRFVSILPLMDHRQSEHPLARVAFSVGLIGMLLLLGAGPLDAHTSVRVALASNIVVDGGRVIFAQGTGSLTVLDLETGQVLSRKKPAEAFSYSGNLQHSASGVLMMAYDRIVLLDGSTFDPVWQAGQCYGAVVDGEYVVSHDGNHTVSCRNVRSGQRSWTVAMEGGWHLLAVKGKVLVTTPDYRDGRPALLVLDLESGRKVLHQEAPPGVRWLQVYFDGELVYVVDDGSLERHTAAAYQEGLGKMNVSCGSIPLPQGFDPASAKWSELRGSAKYAGRIVFDPNPDDPFPNLGWYLLWLAVCALFPIIGASLLLIRLARREAPNQAVPQPSKCGKPVFVPLVVWCLVLSVSPAFGLLQFGRVSHSWTLALKVIFAMAILGAVY